MLIDQAQVERLQANFNFVEGQIDRLVDLFYERLFEAAPKVRALFPDAIESQRRHMTAALLLVAKNIGNLEFLRDPLEQMGEVHTTYGAREEYFPIVCDAMVAAIAEVSRGGWSDELEHDWKTALGIISGYMIDGIRQAHARAA